MKSPADLSIRNRIFLFFGLLVIIFGLFIPAQYLIKAYYQNLTLRDSAEQMNRALKVQVSHEEKKLKAALSGFRRWHSPKLLFRNGDRDGLYREVRPYFEELRSSHEVTHFYFHDRQGRVFLRLHKRDKHGDTINRFTLRQSMETHKPNAGLELGPLGTFTHRVVSPYYLEEELIGYVELGVEVDHLFEEWEEQSASELIFLLEQSYLENQRFFEEYGPEQASNWSRVGSSYVRYNTFDTAPEAFIEGPFANLKSSSGAPPHMLGDSQVGKENFHFAGLPATDARGKRAGWYIFGMNKTRKFSLLSNIYYTALVAFGLFFGVGALLSYIFSRQLAAPLKKLTSLVADITRTGDLDRRVDLDAGGEIGKLASSFNTLLARLEEKTVDRKYLVKILENMSEMLLVVGANGEVKRVNRSLVERLRYTREDLLGESPAEIPVKTGAVSWDQLVAEIFDTGHISRTQLTLEAATGETVPVLVSGTAFEPDETNSDVVFVATDISPLEEAREQLKESEARFRQLAENIEEVFWLRDAADGSLLYVNPAYEDIWGRSLDSLYEDPDSFLDAVHAEDLDEVNAAYQKYQETGEFDMEYRVVRPDGETRWVWARNFPVRDENGQVIRHAGRVLDITERREMEEELRSANQQLDAKNQQLDAQNQQLRTTEQKLRAEVEERRQVENKLRGYLETSPHGFFVTDAEGNYLEVNSAATELTGYSEDELLGMNISDVVAPETRERARSSFRQLEEQGEIEQELPFLTADNDIRHMVVNGARISENRYLGVVADITERKLRQEELERYEKMVESAEEVLWMLTADWSELLFVNSAYEELFGQSVEALSENPRSFLKCVHPEDRLRLKEKMGQLAGGNNIEVEIRVNPGEDYRRWVWIKGQPVYEQGEVAYLTGLSREITSIKEVESELLQTRDFLRQSNRIADIGGWEYQPEEDELFWSDNLKRLFEVPLDRQPDLEETLDFYPEPDREKISNALEECLESGDPFDLEVKANTASGNRIWARARGEPVIKNDTVTAIRGTLQDVTDRRRTEQDLRRKQEAIESTADGIAFTTLGGVLTEVNRAMAEMWNYEEPDQLVGQHVTSLYKRPDEAESAFTEMVEEGFWRGELTAVGAEGEEFIVRISSSVIESSEGKQAGAMATHVDVTERRRREAELRKMMRAIEHSPATVVITDPDGEIEYVNPRFQELTGYDEEEVLGKEPSILKSGYHDKDFYQDMWFSIKAGEVWRGEFRNRKKNGELYWEDASIAPVKDEAGNVTNFIKVGEDITARRQARQNLLMLNDCFLDFTPDPSKNIDRLTEVASKLLELDFVIYTRVENNELCVSASQDLPADYPREDEAEGHVCYDVICEAGDQVKVIHDLSETKYNETDPGVQKYGFETYVGKAIYLRGEPVGTLFGVYSENVEISEEKITFFEIIAAAIEIEEERRQVLDDLQRSNRELQEFANIAAHDLKQPLRTVSSYLELLTKRYGDDLDERASNYTERAVEGARNMKELLDDLLEYSRLRTASGDYQPVEVEEVLEVVLGHLEQSIQENTAQLVVGDLPEVRADRSMLVQLFQNLIDNALTYRSEEPPRIEIEARRSEDRWQFTVRDNGRGMEPEYTERVFEIFERLQSDDEISGTGVGLAICRRIVRQHDGEIRVDSEPGEGSEFHFTLPAVD